jgi:hypothetical protein
MTSTSICPSQPYQLGMLLLRQCRNPERSRYRHLVSYTTAAIVAALQYLCVFSASTAHRYAAGDIICLVSSFCDALHTKIPTLARSERSHTTTTVVATYPGMRSHTFALSQKLKRPEVRKAFVISTMPCVYLSHHQIVTAFLLIHHVATTCLLAIKRTYSSTMAI